MANMTIQLGLTRISSLTSHLPSSLLGLKILHIAGTNGKGSVSAYLTHVLKTKYTVGTFTTPHLFHPSDSISVNSVPVSIQKYNDLRKSIADINSKFGINATEFEQLTCAALKHFIDSGCDFCVLEVGMGGRLDATNVVPSTNKLCGITKISLDHEAFLGNTLIDIAKEKAGVILPGTNSVVLDGTNDPEVIQVVKEKCQETNCQLYVTDTNQTPIISTNSWGGVEFQIPLNGQYQIYNARVAFALLDELQKQKNINLDKDHLQKGLLTLEWPARLQNLNCFYSENKQLQILLDGAHNGSAANELAIFLQKTYKNVPLIFIIAVTKGKNLTPLLKPILKKGDTVIITKFEEVEGMPWIKSMDREDIASSAEKYVSNIFIEETPALALSKADILSKQHEIPVVVFGSLYLGGQILRMHRQLSSSQ